MEQYTRLQQQVQKSRESRQSRQEGQYSNVAHAHTTSSSMQRSAGRVTLVPGESVHDYPLFSEPVSSTSGASAVSSATLSSMPAISVRESGVANVFFSTTNIEALQDGMRYRVNRASLNAGVSGRGYVIGRQNERELGIIMRGVYQQYGRNVPTQIVEQVRDLNAKVLDFAVPRVLQEVMSYHQYRVDISAPRTLMLHGEIVGTKGDKQLGLRQI